MFKIVFRDSSFYPKQLSLFCLLWLSSSRADRIGYITSFCSMIELLHELKTAVIDIEAFEAFDNAPAKKKENYKFSGHLNITQNRKFFCVLDAHSQFLCSLARFDLANRGVRCWMSGFYSPVIRSLIFLQL